MHFLRQSFFFVFTKYAYFGQFCRLTMKSRLSFEYMIIGNFLWNKLHSCFSIKMHTQRDVCKKLLGGRSNSVKKKAAGRILWDFQYVFFGHQSTPLSTIRPFPLFTHCLHFFYMLLFHSLFKVEFDIDHFAMGEHRER